MLEIFVENLELNSHVNTNLTFIVMLLTSESIREVLNIFSRLEVLPTPPFERYPNFLISFILTLCLTETINLYQIIGLEKKTFLRFFKILKAAYWKKIYMEPLKARIASKYLLHFTLLSNQSFTVFFEFKEKVRV